MLREVDSFERRDFYAPVGLIATSWDGKTWYTGTYAMVGINDVLTATHVVYSPARGGWANHVRLYPGADYNSAAGYFEDRPFSPASFYHRFWGYPEMVFTDFSDTTMLESEIQFDVSLIGLSIPLGRDTGWYHLNPNYDGTVQAETLGYPKGPGMLLGTVTATSQAYPSIYTSSSRDAIAMGPGSSGGPLLVDDQVIGVKSAGSSVTSYWADIGYLYDLLVAEMQGNDSLLGANPLPTVNADWLVGTPQADTIAGLAGNDVIFGGAGHDRLIGGPGNDELDGGLGRDVAVFSLERASYAIQRDQDGTVVVHALGGNEGTDRLTAVERLEFSDGTIALDDQGPGGQAYRMYQAAFDRSPDLDGLSFWIHALDAGLVDLGWMANVFAHSAEFLATYGALDSPGFVSRLYANVLHRAGDAGGQAFWQAELDSGRRTMGQVLADFSESGEHQANLIGVIRNGIWYI